MAGDPLFAETAISRPVESGLASPKQVREYQGYRVTCWRFDSSRQPRWRPR
jgi:hypothetical protein